jgi:hypothetical protein
MLRARDLAGLAVPDAAQPLRSSGRRSAGTREASPSQPCSSVREPVRSQVDDVGRRTGPEVVAEFPLRRRRKPSAPRVTFKGEVTAVDDDLITLNIVGSNSLGDHLIANATLTIGSSRERSSEDRRGDA